MNREGQGSAFLVRLTIIEIGNRRTMENHSDFELIGIAIDGNERAFAQLVERHANMVYKVAFKLCGVREDAEDIAQDVFVKLAAKIRQFKPDNAAFTTWLYRVTINTARDFHRRKNTRQKYEGKYAKNGPGDHDGRTPEDKVIHDDAVELICRLPENERATVLLVATEGLSHVVNAATVSACSALSDMTRSKVPRLLARMEFSGPTGRSNTKNISVSLLK